MSSNLLINSKEHRNLEDFVETLQEIIGCGTFDERFSDNYFEGRYFLRSLLGLSVTVSLADSNEFKDYVYWINFESEDERPLDKTFLDLLADHIGRILVRSGFDVLRPKNLGRLGAGAIHYRIAPDRATNGGIKILDEEK